MPLPKESPKSRALRAFVSYVPRVLCALLTHVPRALHVLVPYVSHALRALVPHIPSALVLSRPMCCRAHRALRALCSKYVLPCVLLCFLRLVIRVPRALLFMSPFSIYVPLFRTLRPDIPFFCS